jgi:methylated-DNA-[protein]-cysteine S-methyltransferase
LKEIARADGEERSRRLAARFADWAADHGKADVAYGFADSPFGPLLVALTRRGLVKLDYPDRDFDLELEDLAARVSPRIVESFNATEAVRRQLDEYFDGRRRRFDVHADLSLSEGFSRRILSATARIPFGSVATYREVAIKAGNPKATRAAGNALGSNPIPIVVPCHRVVRTGGGLGGSTGGVDRKVALLRLEGALEEGATRA